MRVFVLCTGRSGSKAFIEACSHIRNYSSSHESRDTMVDERFDYPDNHIEADRLLAWFLGSLGRHCPDAFYVHLQRSDADVARSFRRRFPDAGSRFNHVRTRLVKLARQDYSTRMIETFAHGLIPRPARYSGAAIDGVVDAYIRTVTDNIETYLADRDHLDVRLDTVQDDFRVFWERIGAEGDLDMALNEFSRRHNASVAVKR